MGWNSEHNMVIAHIKRNYLRLTETFIFAFLNHARRHTPLVFTDIYWNADAFPVSCHYLIEAEAYLALKSQTGGRFDAAFFPELDYPNCFEQTIAKYDIPLLHAHFGEAGISALALKKKLGLPLITSFYGIDASKLLRIDKLAKPFTKLFNEGDLFLALGNDMRDRLSHAGCPAEKIRIQHLGVDTERIRYKVRFWPNNDRIVLLYCGRLVAKKGILDLLQAFAAIANKWPQLELRIVGNGPLRTQLKKATHTLNLHHRIKILGALPHADTLREMQNAHMFAMPSLTAPNGDMEGTPTVLLEAQASGLPVISTSHADIPEVVRDTKTGFLVPERDIAALSERVDHLMHHPDLWPQIGAQGRKHIETHYNIRTESARLEETYRACLDTVPNAS